jgi:hypothetical protein
VSDRVFALGPAGTAALVALAIARVRRSRRLGLLGAGLLAVELAPPYRAWVAAKGQAMAERAEAARADASRGAPQSAGGRGVPR